MLPFLQKIANKVHHSTMIFFFLTGLISEAFLKNAGSGLSVEINKGAAETRVVC